MMMPPTPPITITATIASSQPTSRLMRSSDKRDAIQEVRSPVHHSDRLKEIRESLKEFEYERSSYHKNENSNSFVASSSKVSSLSSSGLQTKNKSPQKQRISAPRPLVGDFDQRKDAINRNFTINGYPHDEWNRANFTQNRPPPPSYHGNNNVSPVFQRPPPPAYNTPSSNPRVTPTLPESHRSHLHINTHPKELKAPINPFKSMAPLAPGKSTISIETNANDQNNMITTSCADVGASSSHNSEQKMSNSIVSINVSSPQTTRINVGENPISSKSFLIGPRYTSDNDRSKILVNYIDELRKDPRLIASTSNAGPSDDQVEMKHILFKPPNLDITFQSKSQVNYQKKDRTKRVRSPIDRSLVESMSKHQRTFQPCKPNMFRFYMEQHVERLIQQYREREKRVQQLEKEMNTANLSSGMRKAILDLLHQKESRYTRLRRQKMSKDHFTILKPIGVGAFGKVLLVRKKDTGKAYAMKCLEKADIIMKKQAAHVKAERDILAEADSPWIVRLFFSFQDESCLYFIMEYVPGGDMMTLLIEKGIFGESLAKFYIAELTCAIEYVHSVGFIHRDIKPDNILIDQNGHIKLTDFGLCTGLRWTHDRRYYGPENDHQRNDSLSLPPEVADVEKDFKLLNIRQQCRRQFAHSVVGTGNYMAPEVITRSGHTQSCDWWSMGVILYEMVFGRVPFYSENPRETQFRIVNWKIFLDVSYGSHLSRECINMIVLLINDVNCRIGSNGGAKQIKNHSWFRNIDFETLRSSRPEYIPQVSHAEDTSNFDTIEFTDRSDKPKMRVVNNPAFYEFTYRHFFDTDSHGCPSLRPLNSLPSLRSFLEDDREDISSSTQSGDDTSHI